MSENAWIALILIVVGILVLNASIFVYFRYINPQQQSGVLPEYIGFPDETRHPNPTVQQQYIDHAVNCDECGLLGDPCPEGTRILQRVDREYGILIGGGDNRARP